MPTVSVIVPVYNTKEYLPRCIDALVHQTLKDMEILFIDDGSTDGSLEVLREYEASYPQVRVIHKENGGQATARNLGIREAKGDYVGFADSDDYVDTTMFEKMYTRAVKENCDMVECFFYFIEETPAGRKELPQRGRVREYADQHDMIRDPQVSPWNKLYRREVLLHPEVIFPEGLIYEDTAFYIKTIPYVRKSAYVDEKLVYYFLRGNSTMNANKSVKVGNIFPVLENILQFYQKYGFYEEYRQELEYFCTKIVLCSSLGRIGRVPDKKLQNELLDQSFAFIQKYFPNYKDNPYVTGKIGIYMKHVNRWNSRYIGKVIGKVLKG